MRLFKKEKMAVDERVENIKNKIYKEAFILVIAICFISIIAKDVIYGMKFESVITEVAVIIITCVYSVIRSLYLGAYADELEMYDRTHKVPKRTVNIITGAVFGIGFSLFMGIRSAVLYGHSTGNRIWYFILVSLVSMMIYAPLFLGFFAFPDIISNNISKRRDSRKND